MGIKHFPNGFARYQFVNLKKTLNYINYISCDFCGEYINENIFDEHMFKPHSSNYCLKGRQHSFYANPIFYTECDKCFFCLKIINRPNFLQHMKDCKIRLSLKPENNLTNSQDDSKKHTELQKWAEICLYIFSIDNSTWLGKLLQEFLVDITCRQFTFNLYKIIRYIKRYERLPTYSEWNQVFPTYVYHIFLNLSDIIFVEKPNIIPSLLNDPEFQALGDDWIIVKEMPGYIEKPKFADDGLYLNIGRYHLARDKFLDIDYTSKENMEIQYST